MLREREEGIGRERSEENEKDDKKKRGNSGEREKLEQRKPDEINFKGNGGGSACGECVHVACSSGEGLRAMVVVVRVVWW